MVGLARGVIAEAALRERLSFRLVWLICSTRLHLSAASALHSLPPSGLEAALHYTVVLRPPAHVGTSVAPILRRLHEINPHHHYYPADSMHVTMGGVGQFLHEGVDAAARLAELRSVIGRYQSFDLTVRGLNVSPSTVLAEVIPRSARKARRPRNDGPPGGRNERFWRLRPLPSATYEPRSVLGAGDKGLSRRGLEISPGMVRAVEGERSGAHTHRHPDLPRK